MGGFAHEDIHAQIPDLLREMAQALERSTRVRQGKGKVSADHKPIVRKVTSR
jgi:hypothetical protein